MKHPPQEPDVVPGKLIAGVILGVVASIIIGVVAMSVIEDVRTRELHGDPRAPAEQMTGVPPEVNAIETLPFTFEAQGIEDNALADRVLDGYDWVDRDRQIVRVPIEVAFDLYLARRKQGPVAGRQP